MKVDMMAMFPDIVTRDKAFEEMKETAEIRLVGIVDVISGEQVLKDVPVIVFKNLMASMQFPSHGATVCSL